jgi:hypothetical protein
MVFLLLGFCCCCCFSSLHMTLWRLCWHQKMESQLKFHSQSHQWQEPLPDSAPHSVYIPLSCWRHVWLSRWEDQAESVFTADFPESINCSFSAISACFFAFTSLLFRIQRVCMFWVANCSHIWSVCVFCITNCC